MLHAVFPVARDVEEPEALVRAVHVPAAPVHELPSVQFMYLQPPVHELPSVQFMYLPLPFMNDRQCTSWTASRRS
eukprot:2895714-Rhodomonas_salina.3